MYRFLGYHIIIELDNLDCFNIHMIIKIKDF